MTSLSHQTSKQGLPLLRPYQAEAGRAILASVLGRRGLTFSVMMARQGGKNELSAQLELLLLVRHALRGGNGVKAAPTFRPQLLTSLRRLQDRLDDAGLRGHWETEQGAAVRLGRARWLFYSAEPHSHVVGATAHLLLEIDEAQDVDTEKYEKEFRPMGAATSSTTGRSSPTTIPPTGATWRRSASGSARATRCSRRSTACGRSAARG